MLTLHDSVYDLTRSVEQKLTAHVDCSNSHNGVTPPVGKSSEGNQSGDCSSYFETNDIGPFTLPSAETQNSPCRVAAVTQDIGQRVDGDLPGIHSLQPFDTPGDVLGASPNFPGGMVQKIERNCESDQPGPFTCPSAQTQRSLYPVTHSDTVIRRVKDTKQRKAGEKVDGELPGKHET